MSDKVLEVVNVSKSYKNLTVIDDLSFDIYAGEIFGFIGPNGVGKTTLMKIICGMAQPTHGEVFVCGRSIQHDFERAILNVGTMIDNSHVYPYMSGYQNLTYYAGLYKGIDSVDIDNVIDVVDMSKRIHDKVKTYSYGMSQRIVLAQALLHHPKLLVLDEPTNGLDANGIIELRRTLKILAAKANMAIMVSSHILSEVEQLCDTVAVFNRGKIIELKTMDQLKNASKEKKRVSISVDYPNFAAKIVANKLGFTPELAGKAILLPGDTKIAEAVLKELRANNITIYETKIISKSLEDIYLEILKNKTRK